METTALILALIGVFDNAMTFFACVRVAKSFDSSLQTYVCRLKILQLRLARWGKVVGLAQKVEDVRELKITALDTEEMKVATHTIKQIKDLFNIAKKAHPELIEASDASDDTMFEMLDHMSICKPRKASIVDKAKYAIYKKEDLSKLIDDLNELVSGLHDLIPAHDSKTVRLCNEEASQLLEQGRLHASAISLLEEAAAALDTKLAEAIAKRKEQTAAASTINNYNHGKAINMGNVIHGDQTNHVNF